MIPAQAESSTDPNRTVRVAGALRFGGASPMTVARGVTAAAPGAASAAVGPKAAAAASTPQVHYAAPLRAADGTIDAARTLEAIKARGSRTYSYLLYPKAGYNSARDWASLPDFLVAARARGVKVTVTLTPPASTSSLLEPCSANLLKPFGGRYDTWMVELGRLARHHPNLTAVAMDDYSYSTTNRIVAPCRVFSPGTLTRWNSILTRFAGRPLRVMPVLYLRDIVGGRAIFASIQHEAPEIIWPYTEIGAGQMAAQYARLKTYSPKTKIHIMVYAARFKNVTPSPAVVRTELTIARSLRPASVVIYQQRLS